MARVLIPVKELSVAKRRLASVMTRSERADLVLAMLSDVLAAVAAVSEINDVHVVTRDREVEAVAAKYGAGSLVLPDDQGLSEALTTARNVIQDRSAETVVTLSADLPTLGSPDLRRVLAAATDGACVVAPADRDNGTNLTACPPHMPIPFLFGENSFRRHLGAAEDRGWRTVALRTPGLALDIDCPEDLTVFARQTAGTDTLRCLDRIGAVDRWLRDRTSPSLSAVAGS